MPDAQADYGSGVTLAPPGAPPLKRKRSARGCLVAAGVLILVFGAAFGACAFWVSEHPILGGSGNGLFAPLKPIPVSHRSCPYLRQVHDTAALREAGFVG